MARHKSLYILFSLVLAFLSSISNQISAADLEGCIGAAEASNDTIKSPAVYLIGENQQLYDQIQAKYAVSMLAVCKDDVNRAFKLWMELTNDMQRFADKTEFELKGAKLWLNVFFAADGRIEYMAYYLKPESRNIPEKEMKAFLGSFSKTYKLPVKYKMGFSHYGQVSFPILPENISNQ